jgi:hypothetical protein
MEKKSLLYFGSVEEICIFEDWFNSALVLGPKYRLTLKDAYLCYEAFIKTKGMENSKITKKKFKAFIEGRLKVNGINYPFITQKVVYIIGFDIKPNFKKVLLEEITVEKIPNELPEERTLEDTANGRAEEITVEETSNRQKSESLFFKESKLA